MSELGRSAATTIVAAIALLAGCSSTKPAAEPASDEERYQELFAAHRIAPDEDLPPSKVVAIYDFVQRVDDGAYSGCAQFSINIGDDSDYTVLALNGYSAGGVSGWELALEDGPEGLRLLESTYSPCFYFE